MARLRSGSGYGARDAAAEVATLARRMRAPVMCSPRGKGIFPEDDPLFVGVTGLAGHASVMQLPGGVQAATRAGARLAAGRTDLVLGSPLRRARRVRSRRCRSRRAGRRVPHRAHARRRRRRRRHAAGRARRASGRRAAARVPELPRPRIDRVQPAQRRPGAARSADGRRCRTGSSIAATPRCCRSPATRFSGRRIGCGLRRRTDTAPAPASGRWVTPPPVSSARRWPPVAGRWRSSATAPC